MVVRCSVSVYNNSFNSAWETLLCNTGIKFNLIPIDREIVYSHSDADRRTMNWIGCLQANQISDTKINKSYELMFLL